MGINYSSTNKFGTLIPFHYAFSHLVKDTMSYVSSLRSFSFSHTYRQGNYVAVTLAKRVRFYSSFSIGTKSVPLDIRTLVLADKPLF